MLFWSTIALQRLAYSEQLQRKKEIRSQKEKCNSLQTVEREQYFCLVASEDNLCHIQTKKAWNTTPILIIMLVKKSWKILSKKYRMIFFFGNS